MKLRCDNCGRAFSAENELDHVFPDIPDLVSRLDPGGTVPSGQCPRCGALIYLAVARSAPTRRNERVVITVRGGVAEVTQCPEHVVVEIRDYDTEGCDPDRLAEHGSVVNVVTGPVPDWIDDFAAGAAEELADDGFTEAEALTIASEAADIIREHEAREAGKEVT